MKLLERGGGWLERWRGSKVFGQVGVLVREERGEREKRGKREKKRDEMNFSSENFEFKTHRDFS